MTAEVRLATFASLVGEVFRTDRIEGRALGLELVEARALPSHPGAPREDPFSLLFRAPKDCDLWQETVHLGNEHLDPIELFLVPVGEDEAGRYFEALFN